MSSVPSSPVTRGADSRPRPATAVAVACVALFTDMLVYGLAIPVVPLLPATVVAGPAATGILFAGYAATMIVVAPIAGRLVDRVGPRRPLLVGLAGLATATILFALGESYGLLLLARVLQGVAAGMSWVAGLSLIGSVTPLATRGRTMGLAMSMVMLGVLLGPPLAGLLVDAVGVRAPFLLAATVALGVGIACVVLVGGTASVADDPGGPLTVLRVPGTRAVVAAVVLGAGTIAAVEPVLPPQLSRQFGTGAIGIGVLFAAAVLAGALLNPLVGSLVGQVDARLLVGIGVAASALALGGLALSRDSWQIWIGMGLLGASNAFLMAPATTLMSHQGMNARPPVLGGAYALFNLAYAAGLMLGPLLAGIGADIAGTSTALCGLAVAVALAGVLGLRHLPTGLSTVGRRR